jgi:Protein of unknown function (DUF429)
MRSTRTGAENCVYLGVDITDRYVKSPRPMDVCGLEIGADILIPHFWTWTWGQSSSIEVTAILPEITQAQSVMLDGPQGLAQVGCKIRASERLLAAAGKTADVRPPLTQPYGGFISASLDLFGSFHEGGLLLGQTSSTRVGEVYPATIWTRLARRLPNKRRSDGRQARAEILRRLGIRLPDRVFTHDELDACAAALLGAGAHDRIQGIKVVAVGDHVFWDEAYGCLREGQILVPQVSSELHGCLEAAVTCWTLPNPAGSPEIPRPRRSHATKTLQNGQTAERPVLTGSTREELAGDLFERLVLELIEGRPTLCTYKAAVALILGHQKYTPAYGSQLIGLATKTGVVEVDGLGDIRLDTFLVSQKRRPGAGHWDSATYSEDDWDRAFSGAAVIE